MNFKPWTTRRTAWAVVAVGLVGSALAVAFLAGLIDLDAGSWMERGQLAYERGDWGRAVEQADRQLSEVPDDREALRLKARGLARIGKAREARTIDARVGGDHLEAEDLFLVGRGLMDEGRIDLGSAALEAASKLDRNHRETIEALAAPRGQQDVSGFLGSRLAAVPDPSALAELVIGLASIADQGGISGDADPVLRRFLRLHRPDLLKLDDPSAARKLLARLLLESGNSAQAREWISRVEGAEKEPEADWLLSRAFLVEGRIDQANRALSRAGDFGKETPMALEPSRYVGAARCAECHRSIYENQQNSRHALTLTWGEGLKSTRIPDGPVVDPKEPRAVHRFERTPEKLTISTEIDGQTSRALVEYVLGSGQHGSTMVARDASGGHRSSRISYYHGGDTWGITAGVNPNPTLPEEYVGDLLNEDSFRDCLNCHATRFDSERDRGGPAIADRGIGCERCHGPGDNHIRAIEAKFPDPAIARPSLASHPDRMALCAQCHAANGEIPPSDPRFVRFQATTLPFSRCVTESGGRLDCVTCHNPHKNVETAPAYYEARCLACHEAGEPKTASTDRVAASPCPVNPAKGCIDCHMPKSEEVIPFTRFTDHHIRTHKSDDRQASR